jgi:tRNA threonylcarbamoyladenosine biosynthesis protein TsaB
MSWPGGPDGRRGGAGSFTGLRIGLAVAKGLAWAVGRPLVGVPSLMTLAASADEPDAPVCAVIDARKGQVYSATYEGWSDGLPVCVRPAEVGSVRELAEKIDRPTVFLGDGVRTWGEALHDALGAKFRRGPESLDFPSAAVAARLAGALFRAGAESDPVRIVPLYIRPPDIKRPAPGPWSANSGADPACRAGSAEGR